MLSFFGQYKQLYIIYYSTKNRQNQGENENIVVNEKNGGKIDLSAAFSGLKQINILLCIQIRSIVCFVIISQIPYKITVDFEPLTVCKYGIFTALRAVRIPRISVVIAKIPVGNILWRKNRAA